MPRTLAQVEAWAHANPSPHQGGTWSELCEQFVNNAGDFGQGFASASVDRATAQQSPLWAPASALRIEDVPAGWLLFWDYNPYGHVAFKVAGGRALMASNYVTDVIAPAIGYITAADYTAASGHAYLGASPYHGTETLQGAPMSLLTPADITNIAQAVWKQALKATNGDVHQASSYLVGGWQSAFAAEQQTRPTAAPAAASPVTPAELVTALTDPTVQAALAAAIAKHLPTKITGTLTA